MAGLRSSVDLSRLMMYRMMDTIMEAVPHSSPHTWVDDVVQRCEGTRHVAKLAQLRAGKLFVQGCRRFKLTVASKSTIISSSWAITKSLVESFARLGIYVSGSRVAPDLGVDRGVVHRTRPKKAHRRKAGVTRFRRILKVRRAGRPGRLAAQKLVLSGLIPSESYSSNVFGTSPRRLQTRRRQLGHTISTTPGRCLTTAIALKYGQRDPAHSAVFALLDSWIFLLSHTELHSKIERTWNSVLQKTALLPVKHRWRRNTGTTAAMLFTFQKLNWTPVCPRHWISAKR